MIGIIKHVKDRIQGKTKKGVRRSSKWPMVRKKHLQDNPKCAVCGGSKKVEVHHIKPFHIAPELELEPSNLISLCERKMFGINCHLLVGHLGAYKRANETVEEDALNWNKKIVVTQKTMLPPK